MSRTYTTREEAVQEIREALGHDACDFDVAAMADEMIERDGETVEWLPGNGFRLREELDDPDRPDAFWEVAAKYDLSDGFATLRDEAAAAGDLGTWATAHVALSTGADARLDAENSGCDHLVVALDEADERYASAEQARAELTRQIIASRD